MSIYPGEWFVGFALTCMGGVLVTLAVLWARLYW